MNRMLLFILVAGIGTALTDNLDDISFGDDEPAGSSLDDVSSNDENSSVFAKTEEERRAMLKKVLGAAFKKPGARTRLGQVLPIVRLMSPPQRLALASLVMAQVLADPHDPPPTMTNSKNLTSQLMLPISMDIASMFRGLGKEQEKEKNEGRSSSYPNGLFAPHRAAIGPNIRRPPPILNNGISRRNANVPSEKQAFPPKRRPLWPGPSKVPTRPTTTTTTTTQKPHSAVPSCVSMSNNLCTELHDYPEEEILKSIKRETNQEIFKILTNEPSQLKEGEPKPKALERRQGEGESSKRSMCASTVEYARPKKARATSGQWKFIVNTGDYTQTLRLELCSKPQSQCLFLAEDIDSTCEQVFNYHRLLTWDESNGLTMDVFKVPTCCSCKVMGYNGLPFMTPSPTTPIIPITPIPSIEHPDTNLVANDEPPVVRIPAPPAPSVPVNNNKHGVRVRPYAPPKRRPAVQHRGPPLPLEGETIATDDTRYPPFDNNLRRFTRNNTVDNRYKFNPHLLIPPSPNNRHPALPIDTFDTIHAESVPNSNFATSPGGSTYVTSPSVTFTSPTNTSPSPSSPTKRINYSYHPIIDYFRPQIPQTAENRMGVDWTPIVERRPILKPAGIEDVSE